jgi:hypothetical protein
MSNNANNIPKSLITNIQGQLWGEVFPTKANPPPQSIDGRTAALYTLRDYVTALTFYRYAGPSAPPIPFSIPPSRFYVEWPDSTVDETFPSMAIVQSRADYDTIGLVSYIEEDTVDVYGKGTVLQWQAEYVETINVEVWASKKAERRAILAACEIAFSPTEQMSGVRFMMPLYFNELVCFTLTRREIMDNPDSARNRRSAQLEIEMRFNVVRLVNALTLQPVVKVNVDVDMDTNLPVDLTQTPDARLGPDLQNLSQASNQTSQPSRLFIPPDTSYLGGGGNGFNRNG